jgi:hypothetical protein
LKSDDVHSSVDRSVDENKVVSSTVVVGCHVGRAGADADAGAGGEVLLVWWITAARITVEIVGPVESFQVYEMGNASHEGDLAIHWAQVEGSLVGGAVKGDKGSR